MCVIVREVGTGVGVLNGHHSRRDHAHLFGPTLGIRGEKERESGGETQTMTLIILIAVLLIFGVQ